MLQTRSQPFRFGEIESTLLFYNWTHVTESTKVLDSGLWPSVFQILLLWIPNFDLLYSRFCYFVFWILTFWNPHSDLLDSRFRPSGFRIPTFWILDCDLLDSRFHYFELTNKTPKVVTFCIPDSTILDSGFWTSGFWIPIFWIPDSKSNPNSCLSVLQFYLFFIYLLTSITDFSSNFATFQRFF